jgi:hypothetical protein
MTRLLKNIEAKMTNRRDYIPSPLEYIRFDDEPIEVFSDIGRELRVEMRIGSSQIIPEKYINTATGDMMIEESKEIIGRAISEHVYGELRERLYELSIELRRSGSYNKRPNEIVEELIEMITYRRN